MAIGFQPCVIKLARTISKIITKSKKLLYSTTNFNLLCIKINTLLIKVGLIMLEALDKDKLKNLVNSEEIIRMLTKNISSLTSSDIASLLEVTSLNDLASLIAKKLVLDLQIFNNLAQSNFLSRLPVENEHKNIISEIFQQTILKSTSGVVDQLSYALEKSKGVLFNGVLISGTARILESILQFEKKIDEHFPGASEQIIKSLANGLIALIAINHPVIGTALVASGIVNKVSDFFACENLEKTVQNLKNTVEKIEQDKKLKDVFETGMQVGELSEAASIPVPSISNLSLGVTALKKLVVGVKENERVKAFVQSVSDMASLIPTNKDELNKKLATVQEAIIETIDKQNLPDGLKKSIKDKVNDQFNNIEKDFSKVLTMGISFFQKMVYQQEAATKILEVEKEVGASINKNLGKDNNITMKVTNLVQKVLQGPIAQIAKDFMNSPEIAKELGLNNAAKVSLERTTLQQSEGRKV